MVSEFQIITQADLEEYKAIDYSDIDDDDGVEIYPDETVDAWITQSENFVNGYIKQTIDVGDGDAVPANVKFCVTEIAGLIADNQLIRDKYLHTDAGVRITSYREWLDILEMMLPDEVAEGEFVTVDNVEDWFF